MATAQKIVTIFKLFRNAMARAGRQVSFPKNTNPTKTYQYRFLMSFVEKVENWDLSDEIIEELIESIVAHAKEKGILNRGMALLNLTDMLNVCMKELERKVESHNELYDSIRTCKQFLDQHDISKDDNDIIPKIVKWYQQGKLLLPFLAVSKKCIVAISELPPNTYYIPDTIKLLNYRIHMLKDREVYNTIAEIMGSDFVDLIGEHSGK